MVLTESWDGEVMQPESSDKKAIKNRIEGMLLCFDQRAENGALDPWSLNLRFWGAPIFNPEAPKPLF